METMKAVVFEGTLRFEKNYPRPRAGQGWALIEVRTAGICKTDLEILKGYLGFRGILGHEFLGRVKSCEDPSWMGKRVVGEINASCGKCSWCLQRLGRHCPQRTTLGIVNHDGCMADYCTLPVENLFEVPEAISDQQAILAEPLAAACEILEQVPIQGDERVIVLGDGRLGILCAWALATVTPHVTLVGHHPHKLEKALWRGIRTSLKGEGITAGEADLVIEATGSGRSMAQAMSLCRPRGTIVLKSTVASQENINLAPLVIHELTVVGSRCGRFQDALAMMLNFPDMPLNRLITDRYPLHRAHEAFAKAQSGEALKVVLDI